MFGRSTVKRVLIDAEVVNVTKVRGEAGTTFRILTRASRKYYNCLASFHIPIREGDHISGSGVMEKHEVRNGYEDFVRLTEMPMVQADNSKDGLLRTFLINIKGCSSMKARELYEWLERKVAEANVVPVAEAEATPDHPTTVATWLDAKAEKLCRDGTPELTLQTAFPTLDTPKFLKWWHYYSSVRRMYLLGLTPKEVKRIHMPYDKAYELLIENPYLLITLPLETCEMVLKITKRVLLPTDRRVGEIARQLLSHVTDREWSCTPLRVANYEIADMSKYMAELQAPLFPTGAKARGYGCVVEFNCIYLQYQHEVESGFAEFINQLNHPLESNGVHFKQDGKQPSNDQRVAVELAMSNGISLIPGRGGTGKTQMIKWLADNLDMQQKKYVCVSFTGKAVARIKQVTKLTSVFTIHRLLRKDLDGATVVIVDEASMVETPLFYQFLKLHPEIEQVIFLGDPRQLLPIGWGSLFTELLNTQLPTGWLSIQHRQEVDDDEDHIYRNLQRILEKQDVVDSSNFRLLEGGLGDLYKLANELHDQGKEFTIISPVNRVITDINLKVRDIVNGDSRSVTEPRGVTWRVHDRVMMTENAYSINVMNGEEGRVTDLDDRWIEVQFGDIIHKIPFYAKPEEHDPEDEDDFDPPVTTKMLTLAFCLSGHKSQGSEYEVVIPYICDGLKASSFFCNNLAYVMAGRTKKECYVVGHVDQFQEAIHHDPSHRYENLSKRIQLQQEVVI